MKKLFLLLLAMCLIFASCKPISKTVDPGKSDPEIVPENPADPETPDTPEDPVTPEDPDIPETPEDPEGTDPENPDTPDTPENPVTPENPETPDDDEDDELQVQNGTVTVTLGFADIAVTYTEENGIYTFTASEGFENYEWTTESGYKLSGTNILTLDTSSYPAGNYKFYLTAIKNGIPYSQEIKISKVQE